MTRFYLRLTLIPTVLFTAVLLVIHAQPYDNHDLRQLLLPEGCPAPCFMGIRPGITTLDEATRILDATKWVQKYATNSYKTIVKITWNSDSPVWFATDGFYKGTELSITDSIVTRFYMDTNVTLGNLELSLGRIPV